MENLTYETMKVANRLHVVASIPKRIIKTEKNKPVVQIDDADYLGTGKALCGVIPKGKDLKWWIENQCVQVDEN